MTEVAAVISKDHGRAMDERTGSRSRWTLLVAMVGLLGPAAGTSLFAQDIHPDTSSAVQGERVSAAQFSGTVALTGSGEVVSGLMPETTPQTSDRAPLAERDTAGAPLLTEGSLQPQESSGGSNDFPVTDFVGTMPKLPPVDFGSLSDAGASGFGISLTPTPIFSAQTQVNFSAATPDTTSGQIEDVDSIENPFTHPIGPPLGTIIPGAGSARETVLGPAKSE